jgi:hypothetical protein
MTTLVAQIAPQRSTQYAKLARDLARQELLLSPVGKAVTHLSACTLGGHDYLKFELASEPDQALLCELGMLAMTSAFFVYYSKAESGSGPLLRPLDADFQATLPPDLVMTRRYRGKTNELFTHFLCNVARFSSGFADQPWRALRLLDPLAGGGTTLFTALVLGANVAGIEHNREDVKSTVAFVRHYMREEGIGCQVKEERLKKLGVRWVLTLGRKPGQQCILVQGDAVQVSSLLPGYKPHLIVTDLPYGVQHQGPVRELLSAALPVWAAMLQPSGALVFSWDATRLPREEMIKLVQEASPLAVRNEPPYNELAHRVDRVIKQRDVLVAQPLA